MQLSILRLAPMLGLHALICLFHLQSRPAWLPSQQAASLSESFMTVQFLPQQWQRLVP